MADLMEEFDASLVRLHSDVFKNLVDQAVLAVREPTHRFGLRRIVPAPLRELNIARCQKAASAVEAEQDGVVPIPADSALVFRSRRRSFSICFAHSIVLPYPIYCRLMPANQ